MAYEQTPNTQTVSDPAKVYGQTVSDPAKIFGGKFLAHFSMITFCRVGVARYHISKFDTAAAVRAAVQLDRKAVDV